MENAEEEEGWLRRILKHPGFPATPDICSNTSELGCPALQTIIFVPEMVEVVKGTDPLFMAMIEHHT